MALIPTGRKYADRRNLYAQLVRVSTNTCRTAAQPFGFPDSNRDAQRTAPQLRSYYRSYLGRNEVLDPVKRQYKHLEIPDHRRR
jgi:hypothetical protein